MISWLIRLLAQASCGYCGKPLHQLEERRFRKVSLCKDCFNHLGLAHSLERSTGLSKVVSTVDSTAHSSRVFSSFDKRDFQEENITHSEGYSLGLTQKIRQLLEWSFRFYRRVK